MMRIQSIHQEISSGRFPTVGALARKLELSERTIKRDLQFMRDQLGAPLFHDKKKGGWRYSEPGWMMPPARLTEGDLLAFFIAERALEGAGQSPEASLLRTSIAKLASLLPEHISMSLGGLPGPFSVQSAPHVTVEPEILRTLARAAATRQTVSFDYHSQHRNENTSRSADVLLLHNFAGDWYAIAFDHLRGELRDFHVGRISHLRETGEYFDPPPGWDADSYLRRGFSMMRGGRMVKVGSRL